MLTDIFPSHCLRGRNTLQYNKESSRSSQQDHQGLRSDQQPGDEGKPAQMTWGERRSLRKTIGLKANLCYSLRVTEPVDRRSLRILLKQSILARAGNKLEVALVDFLPDLHRSSVVRDEASDEGLLAWCRSELVPRCQAQRKCGTIEPGSSRET
jgi:hypothetical protein